MYFINLQRCFPSVLKRLSSCKVPNRLGAQAVSSCPFKTNQNREKWVISLEKNVFYLSNLNAVMFGSAQSFEFKLKQHIIFALYTISDILFHCNIFEKKMQVYYTSIFVLLYFVLIAKALHITFSTHRVLVIWILAVLLSLSFCEWFG